MGDLKLTSNIDITTFLNQIGMSTYGDLPDITSLLFKQTTSLGGFDIEGGNSITAIGFPNLINVDPTNTQNGYIYINGLPNLVSVDLSVFDDCPGSVVITDNPSLISIVLSSYSFNHGLDCSGNALTDGAVNAILARAASLIVTPTAPIILNGGTNSPPTGQGLIDKANLIDGGATVITN